jgi:4-diphosphocytidyl-2-C-methyl-D-erythritol kinase
MTVYRARVPAKINLWLEVLSRRADGYHELSSLMLPIEIYDEIELRPHPDEGIMMECDHWEVPRDRSNLAWKAAELFFEATGIESGLRIGLEKNIPVAAGLGGGSADAAGVLLGLSNLFPGKILERDLHGLAARLGADVPFFLRQVPALATGIGERLEAVRGVMDYPLLLIKPPVTVSTSWVYGSLKLTRGKSCITVPRLLADPLNIVGLLQNDLESVTLDAVPILSLLKGWMIEKGAIGALMSGSGPTVFGVFSQMEEAEAAEKAARSLWPDSWVASTRVLGD